MARETLGARIERLRHLVGLSARAVDALARLQPNHTRFVETGDRVKVTARTVAQIADVFGVTIDWLYRGEGPEPSSASVRKAVQRAQAFATKRTGTSW